MRARFEVSDVDSVLPASPSTEQLRDPALRRATEDILALGSAARPLLADLLLPDHDGEDLLTNVLASDCRLAVCAAAAQWRYSDTTEALLEANRMVLDAQEGSSADCRPAGESNRIRGRVAISSGAFVSNSVLRGPVAIADGAVIEDSFIGPYTAIGPQAVVSGAEIDNSMLLELGPRPAPPRPPSASA